MNEKDLSDQDVISRIVENKQVEYFDTLFERYYMMMYRLAYRMCGRREDAEDIAQETFVKAARFLHTFRGDSKFSVWLYRICMNAVLDWRKRRMDAVAFDESFMETAEGGYKGSLDADQIQRALQRLSEKLRSAFVLTVLEDMSHAQAAKILGCAETTVSWRVHLAKKKLRQWLKHFGKDVGDEGSDMDRTRKDGASS